MTLQAAETERSSGARLRPKEPGTSDVLATGLGLFSVGLGLAELLAPRAVARTIGTEESPPNLSVLRAAGLREVSSGVGLLGAGNQEGWLRARVGGDVMDLALLGAAFGSRPVSSYRLAAAVGAVLGVTALDVLASQRASNARRRPEHAVSARVHAAGLSIHKAITINKPTQEVYTFLRELGNFPRFMRHLESVEPLSERRSRWCMRGPAKTTLTWEVDLLVDQPNERIAWRSTPGSELESAGDVHFVPAPGGRGTEVHVALHYRPPGGVVGGAIAKLLNALPKHEIEADLRACKQLLEVGEIVHSDASVHRLPHAARPSALPARTNRRNSSSSESAIEGGAP